jgi:hypothetical protein
MKLNAAVTLMIIFVIMRNQIALSCWQMQTQKRTSAVQQPRPAFNKPKPAPPPWQRTSVRSDFKPDFPKVSRFSAVKNHSSGFIFGGCL